jgi:hypothetical protein
MLESDRLTIASKSSGNWFFTTAAAAGYMGLSLGEVLSLIHTGILKPNYSSLPWVLVRVRDCTLWLAKSRNVGHVFDARDAKLNAVFSESVVEGYVILDVPFAYQLPLPSGGTNEGWGE